MYFGDGTDGDLVVTDGGQLVLKGSNYRNITVKNGSTLIIRPVPTVLFVSGLFTIEKESRVTFSGSILQNNICPRYFFLTFFASTQGNSLLYISAKEINWSGHLIANGQPTNVNGGNVIVVAKRARISGSITSEAYPNGTQAFYERLLNPQGRPGIISLQYQEGEITGHFSPPISPATLCFDIETKRLVPCTASAF